ncbi:hypothetical protein V8G54_016398 [Vigna mungo]|uniref:Uncharacterized protein n=1 Tax=Vigna mungo TaxID=3915 RepID=A0AAQ3S0E6_VIGMU
MRRMELKSGSVSIVRHFPAPCLTTPAFNAASSSAVHFCLGAPIKISLKPFYDSQISAFVLVEDCLLLHVHQPTKKLSLNLPKGMRVKKRLNKNDKTVSYLNTFSSSNIFLKQKKKNKPKIFLIKH